MTPLGDHQLLHRFTADRDRDALDELVRRYGLSWQQVLLPLQQSESVDEMIAYALRHGAGVIGVWEEGFLRGVRGRQFLTKKQLAKLQEIVASVRRNGA